ncbi:MAG: hypothetical protein ACI9OJ_003133 [Myxococcota bacterium]|jgi:hypothetical protein
MTQSHLKVGPTGRSAAQPTATIVICTLVLTNGCVGRYRVNSDELARAKRERGAHYFIAAEDSDGDITYIQSSRVRKDVVDLGDDTSSVTMREPAGGLWIGGALATTAGVVVLSTAEYGCGEDYCADFVENFATITGGFILVAGGLTMLIINAVLTKRFDDEPSEGFSEDVGPLEEP